MRTNIRDFSGYSEELKKKAFALIKLRTEEAGMIAEIQAKMTAPVQYGFHRQNIGHEPINGGMGTRIYANAKYAAYLEFGTGGFVNIPKGFEALALQFKGSGQKQINLSSRPHIIPAAYKGLEYLNRKLGQDLGKL